MEATKKTVPRVLKILKKNMEESVLILVLCEFLALVTCTYKVFYRHEVAGSIDIAKVYVKHICFGILVGVIAVIALYYFMRILVNESNNLTPKNVREGGLVKWLHDRKIYGEQLYITAMVLYTLGGGLADTTFIFPDVASYLVMGATVLLLATKAILYDKYYKGEWLLPLLLLFASVCCLISSTHNLCIIMLFIIEARGVNFDRIVKAHLIAQLCVIIVAFVACLPVVELIVNFTRNFDWRGAKHAMGFCHETHFGGHVFYTTLSWLYIMREKLNIKHLIIAIFSLLYLWLCGKVQLDSLCIILTIIGFGFTAMINRVDNDKISCSFQKFFYGVSMIAAPFFAILNIVLCWKYDASTISEVLRGRFGTLFSRFELVHHALLEAPITLFGIKYDDKYDYYLDQSYINSLFLYGIIITVLLIFLFMKSCYRNRMNMFFAVAAIILALNYFVDERMTWLAMNPFILAAFAEITMNETTKEQDINAS